MKRSTIFNLAFAALIAATAVMGLLASAEASVMALDFSGDIPPEALAVVGAGLIVNQANLTNLFRGFKASFQGGLDETETQYGRIATTVTSTTGTEEYGWLGKVPNVREWIGDRVVQNLMQHDYSIKNKDFELTIGVDRNDISDDKLGIYGPLFRSMGESVAAHPDQLVWDLFAAGFATACYDGQYFFDTDHPVLDENGVAQSVANTDGGSGTAWYLIDDRKALKPIIYQTRKEFDFVAKDRPTDDNVFDRKEYVYGVDGRSNAGFGFWQFAWGSKQTLNKANYKIAREGLMGMTGDFGRPLKIMPRLLIVPPSLENAGLELINAERDAAGATNVYKGTAELLVVPWLT